MLTFLTQLFDRNLGYSTINIARSALSKAVTLFDNQTNIGAHLKDISFKRGVFNLRPALP